jgi:hypothetical protein
MYYKYLIFLPTLRVYVYVITLKYYFDVITAVEVFPEYKGCKDGLERIFSVAWKVVLVLWILIPILICILIEKNFAIVKPYHFENPYLRVASMVVLSGFFMFGLIALMFLLEITLLYGNSISKWLRVLTW